MKTQHGLTIGNLNVCHLKNKIDDVNVLINGHQDKVHIFGISETRLDEDIDDSIIQINNYSIFRKDAEKKDGHTGLVVYVHNSINKFIRRRHDLETDAVEAIWLEIYQKKSKPAYVCSLYRNPAFTAEWIDDFMSMMDKIPVNSDIMLLGDFNYDLFRQQNSWLSVMSMLGLSQLIKDSTRVTKTTQTLIDHIYTNNTEMVINPTIVHSSISDHYAIFCTYLDKLPKQPKRDHDYIQYRSFKTFNETLFLHDIASMPFGTIYEAHNPDKALDLLHMMLLVAIDKHAPLRTKRVKYSDLPPWITPDIILTMDLRDKYKQSEGKGSKNYKVTKNKVTSMVEKARKEYCDKLIENKKDTKTLWRALNTFTKKNKNKTSTTTISPEEFNKHFLSVSERILSSEQIRAGEDFTCPKELIDFCKEKTQNKTFNIPLLTVYEVGKLIGTIGNKKSMGPENIPAFFIQLTLPYIIEPLTFIYNMCIEQNVFPTALKVAKVIPLPKSKDKSNPDDFRPISLLPLLSKPLERHIHKHLYEYLNKNSLLHINQSGFRPIHSCHTSLIKMYDSWLASINKKEVVGTLFLDFRKAFDLVHHSILMQKLSLYLPHSPSVSFLESFLINRSQFVKVNKTTSNKEIVKSGVPQGSVLGPLLFLVYINDLPLHLKDELTSTLFADDSSIHASSSNTDNLNSNLQDGLDTVNSWCLENCMCIHPDKTKSMAITTRQKKQLAPISISLTLGNRQIEQVKEHKVLGVTFDSDLNWHAHLNSLSKRLSRNTYLLSRLRKYTSKEALKLFFEAQINSFINYASTLWDNCSGEYIKRINSIHRRGIKFLLSDQSMCTDDKFKKLKILPLEKQLFFNKAVITHKIYHGMAPPYLTPLLTKASERYGSNRLIPKLPRIKLCKSSLSYSGAKTWNSLPDSLKFINSTPLFKKKLKTYLLDVH